jgi:ABC-type glycerol-3-phosphate transport system permease component
VSLSIERRASDRARVGPLTGHVAMLALGLVTVFPIYWMFATSLRLPNEVFDFSPIPLRPTFDNFAYAWAAIPLGAMLFTTFANGALQTVAHVVTSLLAAYAFARWRFAGDRLILLALIGTWLVPIQVTMIPNYLLLARLGWLDTLAALVVPQLASPFAIVLLRQHMKGFPKDLIDAARIDGATDWGILWRLVVPNLGAPLAALAILSFIGTWNEYFWPLLVTSRPERSVVQVGLQMFLTAEGTQWGPLMAGATMASLPVFAIYAALRRRVIQAFVRSGLR